MDILEVVTSGEVELEGSEALARARDFVRLGRERRSDDGLRFQSPTRRDWLPDEQVKIAAHIVLQRVEEVLTVSESSLATLASLIGSESAKQTDAQVDGIAFATDEGDLGRAITLEQIREARESFGVLGREVERWLVEALNRGSAT